MTTDSATLATPETAAAESRHLPWPVLSVAILSLLALALCIGYTWLCSVLAVVVLASYAVDARLPKGSLQMRTLRLLVMGGQVLVRLSETERQGSYAYIDLYIGLFGQLTATEMALQFWQWPPYGGVRGAAVTCLSGLVFVSATKTEQRAFVPYLTPVYFTFVMLALHRARPRQAGGNMRRVVPALIALFLALGIGLGTSSAIWSWRNELTVWFTKLMVPQGNTEGTGVSQIPVLSATSNLRLSAARVLRVDGPLRQPYLRAMAYDAYGHGVWGPPLDARHFEPVAAPDLVKGPAFDRVMITRLTNDSRLLVAPLHSSGIVLPKKSIECAKEDGGPLRTSIWIAAPATHEIQLGSEAEFQGPLCPPINADYRRRCLYIPAEVNPRVLKLARELTANIAAPRDQARAIIDYLRTHNEYSTTTNPGKGDPVSNFILEHHAAHCEYFASAAVILLRAAKLPARYVTGYYTHSLADSLQRIVRQRDAHAWAECWIDGSGWITLDATPPSGRPDASDDPLPWYTRFSEWLEDSWSSVRDWLADLSISQQISVVLCLAVLILGLQWLRAFRNRRKTVRAIAFSYATPSAELAALGEQFERFLKSHQVPCPAHRTWVEHLSRLTEQNAVLPFKAEDAAAFARRYADVRFGNSESREAIASLVREFQTLS